ncbi:MAG TPA: hypothetical protein VJK48_06145 [Chlamydiales bacterium]|nr:hypothetical protein [Chlamydiales bacterium]
MKKIAFLMGVVAMLGSNAAFAQDTGKGANAGTQAGYTSDAAWGVGLGCLAVLATVVGITAASASNSPSTFSH